MDSWQFIVSLIFALGWFFIGLAALWAAFNCFLEKLQDMYNMLDRSYGHTINILRDEICEINKSIARIKG